MDQPRRSSIIIMGSLAAIALLTITLTMLLTSSSPKKTAAEQLPSSSSAAAPTTSSLAATTSESPSSLVSTAATTSPKTPSSSSSTSATQPAVTNRVTPAATTTIPTAYRGKLLLTKYAGYDGWVDYVDTAGYRHHVPHPAVRDCIMRVSNTGDPIPVSQDTFESYPASEQTARCPYRVGSFLRENGGKVWVVDWADDNHTNIVRRHAGRTCESFAIPGDGVRFTVRDIPAEETRGYDIGGDFWPSDAACHGLANPAR